MIPKRDIERGVEGGARLAFGRNGWSDKFDLTTDGFFNSFASILITAPLFAFIVIANRTLALQLDETGQGASHLTIVLAVNAILYIGSWAGAVAAFAILAKFLDRSSAFVSVIVAYNWTRPVVTAVQAVPPLLFLLGFLSQDLFLFIYFITLLWGQYVTWRVALLTLHVPWSAALAATLIVFLVKIVIQIVIASLAAAGAPPA
ncbi:MAG: hypothetical protein AAGC95_06465 [Pseudomonadota bacterium]